MSDEPTLYDSEYVEHLRLVIAALLEALEAAKQWLFDDDGSPIADEDTRALVNAAIALAKVKP